MKKALTLLGLMLSSCSTAPVQSPAPPPVYRMDLDITVNGVHGVGTLVVDPAPTYHIEVQAPGNSDLVTVRTCSRETPFGKQDKKFSLDVSPNPKETEGSCPITIQAYAQSFNYAGAMIDIRNESVPGRLFCNGGSEPVQGVSLCQSRAGLSERINLFTPVIALKADDPEWMKQPQSSKCPALVQVNEFTYDVTLGKGACFYELKEVGKDNYHRLTTFGYEEYRNNIR